MSIPVIFIHTNDTFYLDFAVSQVHHSNPKNPIYLIGSGIQRRYPFVSYIDIREFDAAATGFKDVYRHMSGNSYEFELFCFQRWFIIREFCRRNNITQFLHLDSDALIFCNIDDYFSKLGGYEFTVTKGIAPHCMCFSSTQYLDEVCKFMMKLYTDAQYTGRFQRKWEKHVKDNIPGGVCDMTAFAEYLADHPGRAKDLAVIENNEVFDDNMNASDGFVMERGLKKIRMNNGIPYGELENGTKIKFNLLHFQGRAKKRLPGFYMWPDLDRLKRRIAMDDFLYDHSLLKKVAAKAGYKFVS